MPNKMPNSSRFSDAVLPPQMGLAERIGFEPTVGCPTPDFESGAIDHSATSPERTLRGRNSGGQGRDRRVRVRKRKPKIPGLFFTLEAARGAHGPPFDPSKPKQACLCAAARGQALTAFGAAKLRHIEPITN